MIPTRKTPKIVAVDPGKSGGLAWQGGCAAMPETEGDILQLIQSLMPIEKCVVEQVGGYAGGKGSPGSAMFNFGRNYGFIIGALMALRVPVLLVSPQKWQKHFSLGAASSCKSKTVWKNKLKSQAQRLFPNQKVTLKTSDALLILKYSQDSQ